MRVLLDTNVILDAVLEREPWVEAADAIWQANSQGRLTCCVTASSLTDIYYVAKRLADRDRAREVIGDCLDNLEILSVDQSLLRMAWMYADTDFEDAVQIAAAVKNSLDSIVTRDEKGFIACPIGIISPQELLSQLRLPEEAN